MEAVENPENANAIVSVLLRTIKARPALKLKKVRAIKCGLKKRLLNLVVIIILIQVIPKPGYPFKKLFYIK